MEDDGEHLKSLGDQDDQGDQDQDQDDQDDQDDQGDQDQDQERFQRIFCAVRCCLPAQSRTSPILKKKNIGRQKHSC